MDGAPLQQYRGHMDPADRQLGHSYALSNSGATRCAGWSQPKQAPTYRLSYDVEKCDDNPTDDNETNHSVYVPEVNGKQEGNVAVEEECERPNLKDSTRHHDRWGPESHSEKQVSRSMCFGQNGRYDDAYFDRIKAICSESRDENVKGPSPIELTNHRKNKWPYATCLPKEMARIYNVVRDAGVPNCIGPRIVLPSDLNLAAWERVFGSSGQYLEMLSFVKYGFPLG